MRTFRYSIVLMMFVIIGCGRIQQQSEDKKATPAAPVVDLTGQWRATIQFQDGPLAEIKALEFMYVFNAGGTMTESSNFDAAPPVPPAYGIWRKTGENRFEAKYEFYLTRPPATAAENIPGGGWLPAGRGVFVEQITMAADGKTYTSTIDYQVYEGPDKPPQSGGKAQARATRLLF